MADPTDAPEEWRPVVGWEQSYEISSIGNVRSVDRLVITKAGATKSLSGRTLTQHTNDDGYRTVKLYRPGLRCDRRVHVMVLEALVGPRPRKTDVARHVNHVRHDNRPGNLLWGSKQDNANDMVRAGRQRSLVGMAHGSTRYATADIERALGLLRSGLTLKQAAATIGIYPTYLADLSRGLHRPDVHRP